MDTLLAAWPRLVAECRQVLAGELHYQAMVYHTLRSAGVPLTQLGMNVKQFITDVVSARFRQLDERKHVDFRGGFEPIPDVMIFGAEARGNWQRRSAEVTLRTMRLAIEVKASERANSRLSFREIFGDLEKLAAHREEVRHRGSDFLPVMMIIDVAVPEKERMTAPDLARSRELATKLSVALLYVSQTADHTDIPGN